MERKKQEEEGREETEQGKPETESKEEVELTEVKREDWIPCYKNLDDSDAQSSTHSPSSSSSSSHSSSEQQEDVNAVPCSVCELCEFTPNLKTANIPRKRPRDDSPVTARLTAANIQRKRRKTLAREEPGAALAPPLPNVSQATNFALLLHNDSALIEDKQRLKEKRLCSMPAYHRSFLWFNNAETDVDRIHKPVICGLPSAGQISEKCESLNIRDQKPAVIIEARRNQWQQMEQECQNSIRTIADSIIEEASMELPSRGVTTLERMTECRSSFNPPSSEHLRQSYPNTAAQRRAAGSLNQPVLTEIKPALKTDFLCRLQTDFNNFMRKWKYSDAKHRAQTYNW